MRRRRFLSCLAGAAVAAKAATGLADALVLNATALPGLIAARLPR